MFIDQAADVSINRILVKNQFIKVIVVIDKNISGLVVKIVFINKILEEEIFIVKISYQIIDTKTKRDTRESS